MSPGGAFFVQSPPPKTGTNLRHPRPPQSLNDSFDITAFQLGLRPNHVPEISMKECFRNMPARLTGIDDVDDSVVPSLTETEGQPDTVKMDDSGAKETVE